VQLFAGLQAIGQQLSGHPIAFANPMLYARHAGTAYDDVTGTQLPVVRHDYTDISDPTSPQLTRVITLGQAGLLHAIPGYDNLTGLGTPSTTYLTAARKREVEQPGGETLSRLLDLVMSTERCSSLRRIR
jgi:hypothetical protein